MLTWGPDPQQLRDEDQARRRKVHPAPLGPPIALGVCLTVLAVMLVVYLVAL